MLLPATDELIHDFEIEELPTNTFFVDFDVGIVHGFVDGLEAMRQAIRLILSTERFQHEIYSWDYGSELSGLVGQSPPLLYINIQNAITNALLADDRVLSVDEFEFSQNKGKVHVQFSVKTTIGQLEHAHEVVITNGA